MSTIRIDGSPEFCRALAAALAETMKAHLNDALLLDAGQAAQILGLTVPTFRNLAEREGIRSYDFGERNTRWSLADIQALAKRREVKGR